MKFTKRERTCLPKLGFFRYKLHVDFHLVCLSDIEANQWDEEEVREQGLSEFARVLSQDEGEIETCDAVVPFVLILFSLAVVAWPRLPDLPVSCVKKSNHFRDDKTGKYDKSEGVDQGCTLASTNSQSWDGVCRFDFQDFFEKLVT